MALTNYVSKQSSLSVVCL